MSNKSKEIDVEKKYKIPEKLAEIKIDDKILIISIESSNWIVLNSENEKVIFDKLKKHSIEEVIEFINDQSINQDELINVLTQLEAKEFESLDVTCTNEDKGMYIYLTNKCNLRCKHCYMFAGKEELNELTSQEIFKLLKDFYDNNGKMVTFTGGEVTQRSDLIEILKYSSKLGLVNTVLTNGVEWNEELVNKAYQYINEVQISIDGYDEDSNSNVRGNGNFGKAMSTAELFFEKNVRMSIAITPLFDGLENLKEEYVQFGKTLIDKFKDGEFHLKFNYELLEGRNINLGNVDNKKYSENMHYIVDECYENSEEEEFILNHKYNVILNNCGYGGITVAANGDLYFCNRIHELKSYGNIRKTDFTKIMELSKTARKLSDINNLKPCCNCELKYICGGGCRIANFPELVSLGNLNNNTKCDNFQPRKCSKEIKEKYYRMMIRINEQLFR